MRQDADPGHPTAAPDWEALEQSPEFQELVSTRRRLQTPLLAITTLGLAIYTVLLVSAGDGFLGDGFIGSFTWGLLLVVLMTVFIFVMAAIYSRVSLGTLDPLVERTREAALRGRDDAPHDEPGSGARGERAP